MQQFKQVLQNQLAAIALTIVQLEEELKAQKLEFSKAKAKFELLDEIDKQDLVIGKAQESEVKDGE